MTVRTVCVCGSMRFEREMREAAVTLSLAGHIVLLPLVNMRNPDPRWHDPATAERIKARLDRLHLAKIEAADEIVVVAPGGYIGDSTRREITYAVRIGTPCYYEFGDCDQAQHAAILREIRRMVGLDLSHTAHTATTTERRADR